MLFFTADCHFAHTNAIRYCNRPFDSVEEMDEAIIKNWNSKVTDNDVIYHIGDFCFSSKPEQYLKRLNGEIHLMIGDHDKQIRNQNLSQLAIVHKEMILQLKLKDIQIILCHWCMRVWPRSHYNTWHIFGHSHGRLEARGKSHDVGVDNNYFLPLSLYDLNALMSSKKNNFNCIRGLPGYTQEEFEFYRDKDQEDVDEVDS